MRIPLKELSSQLDPEQFVQVHRSVIVNLGSVSHVTRGNNETAFRYVQQNWQGQDKEWLRYTLGRPGEVRGGGWQGGQVWSWRYPTTECFWFQVSVMDDGKLRDGGAIGIDPRCDPGSGGGASRGR